MAPEHDYNFKHVILDTPSSSIDEQTEELCLFQQWESGQVNEELNNYVKKEESKYGRKRPLILSDESEDSDNDYDSMVDFIDDSDMYGDNADDRIAAGRLAGAILGKRYRV